MAKVKCMLCNKEFDLISPTHLWKEHRYTMADYFERFPDAKLAPGTAITEGRDFVVCMICGKKMGTINATHLKKHNMNTKEYRKMFPESSMTSGNTSKKRKNKLPRMVFAMTLACTSGVPGRLTLHA